MPHTGNEASRGEIVRHAGFLQSICIGLDEMGINVAVWQLLLKATRP